VKRCNFGFPVLSVVQKHYLGETGK